MSDDPEHTAGLERLDRALSDLGEHFDGVQIFVTKHTHPDGDDKQKTFNAFRGSGNWYSRYGQVREWVVYEEERIRAAARESHAHERLQDGP